AARRVHGSIAAARAAAVAVVAREKRLAAIFAAQMVVGGSGPDGVDRHDGGLVRALLQWCSEWRRKNVESMSGLCPRIQMG
nr:hypothetical protein [Tanacetum cinerariifolium]